MKKNFRPIYLFPMLLCCELVLFAGLCVRTSLAAVHVSVEPSGSSAPSGATLFHEKGCEYCHGASGVGVIDKGPSLRSVGKRLSKDAIAHQIHDGGGGMPAFGDALQPDEITALVKMLSKMKKESRGLRHPALSIGTIQH